MNGNGYGSGEEVMGVDSEFYTTAMLVPDWEQGIDFVSNEQWMSGPNGGWAEDGQLAGAGINDDALYYFYAFKVGSGELNVTPTPLNIEGYQWHNYGIEDAARNGDWCVNFNHAVEACETGFATYSPEIQVGMEAADELQPENAGKDLTGAQFTNGGWYHWGSKTQNETRAYGGASESSYICATDWEPYAGEIQWGTPKSSYPC
jgi:hypothetical protein